MEIELLHVLHASPVSAISTAAGPRRVLDAGLAGRLQGTGHAVEVREITRKGLQDSGAIGAEFALSAAVSRQVAGARRRGRLPVVLSGSCHAGIGGVAGLESARPSVVWLDAHPDFNTPETTKSGLLDGMVTATLTGRCWAGLRATVPGFRPVDDRSMLMLGVREPDEAEARLLDDSAVTVLSPAEVPGELETALEALARRTAATYVHLDLDVLDASEGRANAYATPGGLSRQELAGVLAAIRQHCGIDAFTLASYDPSADPDGAACEAAIDAVEAAVGRS